MTLRAATLGIVLGLAACATGRPSGTEDRERIPDTALGLSPGPVLEPPAPPILDRSDSLPGERPALPRPYRTAPPRIPHAVEPFLPITRSQNSCIFCHSAPVKERGGPTPIPASHFTDPRGASGPAGETISGSRWDCLLCHVTVSGARPLVPNRFQP